MPSKTRKAIVLLLLLCLLGLTGCKADENEMELEEVQDQTETAAEPAEPATIMVHVSGQVKTPGVYELAAGARVVDALEAAGGLAEGAVDRDVNLAELLSDGQRLHIFSAAEAAQAAEAGGGSVAGGTAGNTDGKVSLNRATREELMTLPGIGEAKADAIISYREEHGSFKAIEDIKNISGIKDGVFNKIKDSIKL